MTGKLSLEVTNIQPKFVAREGRLNRKVAVVNFHNNTTNGLGFIERYHYLVTVKKNRQIFCLRWWLLIPLQFR